MTDRAEQIFSERLHSPFRRCLPYTSNPRGGCNASATADDEEELFELDELLLEELDDLDDELDDFDEELEDFDEDELEDFDDDELDDLDDDDDELDDDPAELELDEELEADGDELLDDDDPAAVPPPPSVMADELCAVTVGDTGLPPQPVRTPAAAAAPPDRSNRK